MIVFALCPLFTVFASLCSLRLDTSVPSDTPVPAEIAKSDAPQFPDEFPTIDHYRPDALTFGTFLPLSQRTRHNLGTPLTGSFSVEDPLQTLYCSQSLILVGIGTFVDGEIGKHFSNQLNVFGAGMQLRVGFGTERSLTSQPYGRLGTGLYVVDSVSKRLRYTKRVNTILPGAVLGGGIEQVRGAFVEGGIRFIPRYRGINAAGLYFVPGYRF
jgi:hypothetical protein